MKNLETYCASLTPLNKDYSINYNVFFDHCNNLLDQGADGIVIFGTTGEANLLSLESKMKSMESFIKKGFNPSKLLPGTGLTSMQETIQLSNFAKKLQMSGVLVLPSYYYSNPTDQGVIDYYSNIVESVCEDDFNVLLYHIPQTSGVSINLNIIENLIKRYPNNIVGIKDSENNLNKMTEIIDNFPNFKVFSGSDSLALSIIKKGAVGAITATANISVQLLSFIVKNAKNEEMKVNLEKAHLLQDKIRKIVFSQEQISFMKALMHIQNKDNSWETIMPPLIPLANGQGNQNINETINLLNEMKNLLSSF